MSPPSSSFTHLKPTRLRLVLAQQPLREGPTPYCRQFWSNICPRKNKSPLSLTTGRASLVSNRALLNRRRITDLREVGPFRLLSAPSFRSRSTSSSPSPSSSLLGSYPARLIFFPPQHRTAQTRHGQIMSLFIRLRFLSKTSSHFYRRYFVFFSAFSARSIVSDDLSDSVRLKSRAPTEECETLS